MSCTDPPNSRSVAMRLIWEGTSLLLGPRRPTRNATLHADGKLAEKLAGTPQGSPASPVLANICLHALLDTWFVKHWATKGEFVRYADDAIFVFTDEEDAHSFQQALGARLAEAGLKLNLDKTRIVPFSASAPKGTITLLGFELYWGQHIGKGKRLKVKTIPKRLIRAMQNFKEWVKAMRNRKTLATIWDMAGHKLVGHYNYYGGTSNEAKLSHFYWSCVGALYRWLNRRSQKRSYNWEQFLRRLSFSPLPRPPRGPELIDISSEHGAARKHKPKSARARACFLMAALCGCHGPLPVGPKVDAGACDDGSTLGCRADAVSCRSFAWDGAFSLVGSMDTGRVGHTASLLGNGKVLVVGGASSPSAELYDPTKGLFDVTGETVVDRREHTATLLGSDMVLIAGGRNTLTAELYDPAAARFAQTGSMTPTGSMTNSQFAERYGHTATMLADGSVLITGGGYGTPGLGISDTSANLYDPANGVFRQTGSMSEARVFHTATLLVDGRVLIAGGTAGPNIHASAELYDPSTGEFAATGSMTDARLGHSATLLSDGRVLIAGGQGQTTSALSSAEVYDPARGLFATTGGTSSGAGRRGHTATLLCDGNVLLAGGTDSSGSLLATTEIYFPQTGSFEATGGPIMAIGRADHTATSLSDGRILVIGGNAMAGGTGTPAASAEIYQPEN